MHVFLNAFELTLKVIDLLISLPHAIDQTFIGVQWRTPLETNRAVVVPPLEVAPIVRGRVFVSRLPPNMECVINATSSVL